MSEHPLPPAEADDDAVAFERKLAADDEIDMTPMIDCVFLLLIFFLVTASFQLQKALEVPAPEQRDKNAARTMEEVETDDDYVIVRIDADNTVWVNDSEAPSEQDLLLKLREARQSQGPSGRGPSTLLVLADSDAKHEIVVRALDAGIEVGMEHIRLASADEIEL